MKKAMFLMLTVFAALSYSAELFATSFAHTYGFSTRGIARGNAMCATVDDWSSVYYNLAGLGKTPPRPLTEGGKSRKVVKSILEEETEDNSSGCKDLRNEMGMNYLMATPSMEISFTEESNLVTRADQDLELSGIV